jgi:bifunctional DNA-binding transcriptional regulator/antitoxin component of YhaV-PrlF toxin-antitoxin module
MLHEKDVTVTSKGQLTLPAAMRRTMKLGAKRKVRLSMTEPGVVTLRPLADVMSFFGALKSNVPYDPQEKAKARAAMGRHAARRS